MHFVNTMITIMANGWFSLSRIFGFHFWRWLALHRKRMHTQINVYTQQHKINDHQPSIGWFSCIWGVRHSFCFLRVCLWSICPRILCILHFRSIRSWVTSPWSSFLLKIIDILYKLVIECRLRTLVQDTGGYACMVPYATALVVTVTYT